jgi:signal transduction histidine kinase
MNDCITTNLFAALDILVLERVDRGLFRISGGVPGWLRRLFSEYLISESEMFIALDEFNFLENFLIDAEEFWQRNGQKKLKSGLWCQVDLSGDESFLEATALCVDSQKILLIELLDDAVQEKQYLLQKTRESELNCQFIVQENQNKQEFIQCIIHDLVNQLNSINGCFTLLDMENLTPEGRKCIEIGKRQSRKQEKLIRQTLKAFSTEVRSLESFTTDAKSAPDILASVQELIQLLSSTFAVNKVQLQLAANIDMTANWKVVGDKSSLERVIGNLLENAFRHSPRESTVTIGLQQDGDYTTVTVDDEGPGVSPEIEKTLFQKFSQGNENSGKAGLGLYFCRTTVEHWGGTIGYSPRPEGGSRFWFRLPTPMCLLHN